MTADTALTTALTAARWQQAAYAARRLYAAGATRVWLFGSIARGHVRDPRSDLDLAVNGLEEGAINSLRRELHTHLRCKVDVVSMDRAMPQLRDGILKCRVPLPLEACEGATLAAMVPQLSVKPASLRRLNEVRLDAVCEVLEAHRPASILDLGCGPGLLLERLASCPGVERLTGVDIASSALHAARQRWNRSSLAPTSTHASWICAPCTNPDPRFLGHDAVVATELIEHLDPPRLAAFARVLFAYLRPGVAILTTPNVEFNARWGQSSLRHADHRFEWTRAEFARWLDTQDSAGEYDCRLVGIGTAMEGLGSPTQMAVLTRRRKG